MYPTLERSGLPRRAMRGSGGNPTADRQISDGDVEAPLSASMRVDQYQSDREREIESESPSKAGASSIEEKDEEKRGDEHRREEMNTTLEERSF